MSNITFKVITDLEEAKQIWNLFSAHKVIDDEWEFRYAWIKPLNLKLHFIVGYDNDKPIGLLALQLNNNVGIGQKLLQGKKPFLEFFGGLDTDDNKVILAPGYENLEIEFLKQINDYAILASMAKPYTVNNIESEHYNDRFEVDLEGLTDFNSYIDRFTGKTRRNLKSDMKNKLKDENIQIIDGTIDDLELLFKLSIDRFGDNSSFNMSHRREIFKELFNLFKMDLFKILINGDIKAAGYAFVFNDVYTGLNMGYDYTVPSLGKFTMSVNIERAIKFGCKKYDAGKGDNGYKERLKFTKIPQYKLTLNA